MRRKEKQIKNKQELEQLISKADVCNLAMSLNDLPYVVPLCFGYVDDTLFFHSADEGKKLDMIKQNPNVCFQMSIDSKIVVAKDACNWGMNYKSIIGSGIAVLIEEEEERKKGLDLIMKHYANGRWDYKPDVLRKTTVFKVTIKEMIGKQSGT